MATAFHALLNYAFPTSAHSHTIICVMETEFQVANVTKNTTLSLKVKISLSLMKMSNFKKMSEMRLRYDWVLDITNIQPQAFNALVMHKRPY